MSELHSTADRAEVLRRAYVEVRKLRARVDELEAARTEPIAIIGMGCRFPGDANDPAAFWELLREGRDAISAIPADRWDADAYYDPDPEAIRKMCTREGGFLKGVDLFDPQFFGITPREAVHMDPQQRILMEVAWEALEDAAIAPATLQGSRSGVFLGLCGYDYSCLMMDREPDLNAYMGSGSAHSVASGRLSYVLGLQGPSVALDTACSSSLVALHLACQSLRSGECGLALAGGANLVLLPEPVVMFSKAHMLAPDGRCKTFDASANGYVRSEGCGIVVLKRYSDALRDGDRVLALIRGSAVNQDGRSSGLTAPNGPAQEAVIREALANADRAAPQIDYVETHGTGTPLGDPIEVQALGRVYGEGRDAAHPLLLGSVKTNVGHTEAAAGMASLIKTVLAIRHGEAPASLHVKTPNPRIPWDRLPVRVANVRTVWPDRGRPRAAGISSFGFSGTNAHVIVEQAPAVAETVAEWKRPLHVMCLSARTPEALSQLTLRYQEHLSLHGDASFEDVCFTANTGRAQFSHRLALIAANSQQAAARLAAFHAGRGQEGVVTGLAGDGRREVTFLFTGQGSQYAGMGRRLFETQPAFRAGLLRCEELFRPHLPRSITDVLYGDATDCIDETIYTQSTVFALQFALTELWRSWGIVPDSVMGHSVGEYAAACAAGVFTVEDAVTLIAARGRLMQALAERGSMAAVMASEARVAAAIRTHSARVSIASVNGAEVTVISGASDGVRSILAELAVEGVHTQPLSVSHAFHSPLMEPMLDEFEKVAATLRISAPTVPFASSVTGAFARPGEVEQPAYWRRHIRDTVQFAAGMTTLHGNGHRVFVEIGPSPTLIGMGRRAVPEDGAAWHASIRKTRDEWEQMLETAASLYIGGADVDWAGFDRGYARRKVSLPTYPFQRERYWIAGGRVAAPPDASHPFLGRRLNSPLAEVQYEAVVGAGRPSMLQDHKVNGVVVFPGAAYLEAALSAAGDAVAIENVTFHQMLALRDDARTRLQLILDSAKSFRFLSQAGGEDSWTCHASGSLAPMAASTPERLDLADLQSRCEQPIDIASFYSALDARGLQYGPQFQCLRGLWRGKGEALARISCPAGVYRLHPAMLDSCFQATAVLFGEDEGTHVPIGVDALRCYRGAGESVWCHVQLRGAIADLRLFGDTGELVARVDGLRLKRLGASTPECFYELEWQKREAVRRGSLPGAWTVCPASGEFARELTRELKQRGEVKDATARGVIYIAPEHESQPCSELLTLVQSLADRPARLCIVIRDGALEHAPIAGMARVIALEHPELRALRIAIDVSQPAVAARQVADELAADSSDPEVAYRNGRRYVPRIVRANFSAAAAGPGRLEKAGGLLDAVSLRPHPRRAPGPGEIEIRVRAAGLNFR
ncbi:MAG TPA: beta-ketoacyl synthase N-terminal-like domain-containing protein, partial [Candidatus Acidoferrum sp.]|nr:beta-ketoacyl synthase N-terminal-like domain-containing protein [Candidatus Acidoferrum sp.]